MYEPLAMICVGLYSGYRKTLLGGKMFMAAVILILGEKNTLEPWVGGGGGRQGFVDRGFWEKLGIDYGLLS